EAGFYTPLYDAARTLGRMAEEGEKPDNQRVPEFTNARRASLELALFSPAPVYDDFEKMKLATSLALLQKEYGANDPLTQRVLKGKTPEARAAELIEGTKLKDVEFRKQLAAGGMKAIRESKDPMIELAMSVDEDARAVRKRYEEEVVAVERAN